MRSVRAAPCSSHSSSGPCCSWFVCPCASPHCPNPHGHHRQPQSPLAMLILGSYLANADRPPYSPRPKLIRQAWRASCHPLASIALFLPRHSGAREVKLAIHRSGSARRLQRLRLLPTARTGHQKAEHHGLPFHLALSGNATPHQCVGDNLSLIHTSPTWRPHAIRGKWR